MAIFHVKFFSGKNKKFIFGVSSCNYSCYSCVVEASFIAYSWSSKLELFTFVERCKSWESSGSNTKLWAQIPQKIKIEAEIYALDKALF